MEIPPDVLNKLLSNSWIKGTSWLFLLWLVTNGVRRATKEFDDDLSPEMRDKLAEQLRHHTTPNADWMITFRQIFTRVFGNRHFSWFCFRRSVAISAITFVLLGLSIGTFVIQPPHTQEIGPYWPYVIVWAAWLLILFLFGIVYHGLIDYVSLLKARLIIKSSLSMPVKIFLELVLTGIIVYVGFLILIFVLVYAGLSVSLSINDIDVSSTILLYFFMFVVQFKFPPHFGTVAFVIFATSFTVSIWVIIHALSVWIIRLVPAVFSALNVDQKPIRALGVISIGIIWFFGLSVAVIAKLLPMLS